MLRKFLSNNEPLELNLINQIEKSNSKFISLYKAFFVKIYRKLYKFFQRQILKPSIRQKFSKLEKIIFSKDYAIKKNNNLKITKRNSENIRKKSFVKIDNIFSQNQILQIKKEFSHKKLKLDPIYGKYKKFNINDKIIKAHTGYIPSEKIFSNETIISGATNENLLNTVKLYFNSSFKLDWIWCWWSIPAKKPLGPQLFHRDYESMNSLKFFVYLTDVNQNNGPHEIISGAHNDNNFYLRERFKDNEINLKYKKKIKTIYGKSGTNFLANTFSIHRGKFPKSKKRLVLVYLFSIIPSNRCPKLPFMNVENFKDKNLIKRLKENKNIFDQFFHFNSIC
jgi:hypothetical protein